MTSTNDIALPPAQGFGLLVHWRTPFALAWPVMLSRAGLLLTAMASVVMVGRYDTLALAQISLGFAVFIPVFMAGVGCLAVSMVFDAGQVVLGQTARALGDGWRTTRAFFAALWLVMVPVAFALAFLTPLAEAGLFIGTGLGCVAATILLGRPRLRPLGPAAR